MKANPHNLPRFISGSDPVQPTIAETRARWRAAKESVRAENRAADLFEGVRRTTLDGLEPAARTLREQQLARQQFLAAEVFRTEGKSFVTGLEARTLFHQCTRMQMPTTGKLALPLLDRSITDYEIFAPPHLADNNTKSLRTIKPVGFGSPVSGIVEAFERIFAKALSFELECLRDKYLVDVRRWIKEATPFINGAVICDPKRVDEATMPRTGYEIFEISPIEHLFIPKHHRLAADVCFLLCASKEQMDAFWSDRLDTDALMFEMMRENTAKIISTKEFLKGTPGLVAFANKQWRSKKKAGLAETRVLIERRAGLGWRVLMANYNSAESLLYDEDLGFCTWQTKPFAEAQMLTINMRNAKDIRINR